MTTRLDNKKCKLGLALSGGGARGFAHLGALKAIEDFGLKPELISGTSAGSLAGVFYADGYAPEEILQIFVRQEIKQFAEFQVPRVGIFSMVGLRRFLKKHIRSKNFEKLNIPLKVIATDLDDGVSVIFEEGPIIEPVIASCSIPIVFNPVVINGVNYVDGGLFKNFPVSTIRGQCEKLIGINVSPLIPKKYNKSILHIAERSYHYMFRANTLLDRKLCDVLVETDAVAYYKMFDIENAKKIFDIGYDAACRALQQAAQKDIFTILCSTENGEAKVLLP